MAEVTTITEEINENFPELTEDITLQLQEDP